MQPCVSCNRCNSCNPCNSCNLSQLTLMKTLLTELRRAACATLALAVVCCGLYPLVVFGIAQAPLSRQGQRQPDRRCRRRARLAADRPALHRGQVLPPAPLRRGQRLRLPPIPAAATSARPRRSCATPSPRTSPITAPRTAWPPTPPSPPTPSPPPAAGSTRISAWSNARLQADRVAKARSLNPNRSANSSSQTPTPPSSASSAIPA